jgi:adenine-specific DNA-methyltransferase
MRQEQPEKLDLRSHDITEDKRQELLRLFPEIYTEGGKIDFERLKLAVGETVDVGKERYGMNWPGKADCFKNIQMPSLGTLRPCPEESVNFATDENLIIEGDNLEVLKLLQKSYLGKVKMIYIDPPYNTGNDFIYPDNYTETLHTYLEYTGQIDAERKKFSTNAETDGRFHSKWLNMMYPRLYLASNLLREDGVIFISIHHAEIDNLKKICNEVFGEEHFLGIITWKARVKPVNIGEAKYRPQGETEYVLAYEKSETEGKFLPLLTGGVRTYPHSANGRKYRLTTILKSNRGANYRTTMSFELGGYSPPEGQRWQAGEDVIKQLYRDGYIEFKEGTPFHRYYEDEEGAEHDPFYCFMEVDWSSTSEAGKLELTDLIGENHGFDTVKPTRLLTTLLQSCTRGNDIVLDFFAGSGTTAHALLNLNQQDGGKRNYILVQLPEPLDPTDKGQKTAADFCDSIGKPRNIAEIMKERIRRVIKKLNDDKASAPDLDAKRKQDRGFKIFQLAESNFKPWNAELPHEAGALEKQLDLHVDHIREGRTADDLLYEILLKSGFPLTTPVEVLKLASKTVYSVAEGALFICLEQDLTLELIRAMAEKKPERVVCLDEGFADNDQLKANSVQIFKTKGVTSFKTV